MLNIDRGRLKPFFERVPELFQLHHHGDSEDAAGYERLLYRVHRPFSGEMLDTIDDWMGCEPHQHRGEELFRLRLFLLAIRYPDTLLLESLDDVLVSDIRRLSGYLHFTKHTYSIWDDDSRRGLARLGFDIPPTSVADPFIYGAYCASIELLKELAPFYSFLEHDVPRQRLFQAALAAYGRES